MDRALYQMTEEELVSALQVYGKVTVEPRNTGFHWATHHCLLESEGRQNGAYGRSAMDAMRIVLSSERSFQMKVQSHG